MELLDTSIVPEHAQDIKREAREFAAEHIAPNGTSYFNEGDYPWDILEAGMDAGLDASGHGLGLAAAAIEESWDFVHDREAFGRNINEFQAVQHDLAEMRLEFESARALTWRAVDKIDNNDHPGLWAAMAKTKSTETATKCAEHGMQLHGGRSVLNDRRIARVYRDSRIPVIYEGANEVQRNLIYSQQG